MTLVLTHLAPAQRGPQRLLSTEIFLVCSECVLACVALFSLEEEN